VIDGRQIQSAISYVDIKPIHKKTKKNKIGSNGVEADDST
jgi:hypothetical protein